MAGNMTSGFCMGGGRVMLPGFQIAHGDNPCVLFLFQGWALDTQTKYVLGVLGAFAMGMLNEFIASRRTKWAEAFAKCKSPAAAATQTADVNTHTTSLLLSEPMIQPLQATKPLMLSHPRLCALLLGSLYGLQMLNAYWLMLLVMLYEGSIFTAILLGLVFGFILFSPLLNKLNETAVAQYETVQRQLQLQLQPPTSTKPCCHSKVKGEKATQNTHNANAYDSSLSTSTLTSVNQAEPIDLSSHSPCCGGAR